MEVSASLLSLISLAVFSLSQSSVCPFLSMNPFLGAFVV